ncbi:MAG TPA: apolipoprotein N-acyltransferase [Candidatus Paceibacterota bacterium]|nr:apolipoprotein N-acyltransferase [Candidatus Paceibacterota bacterium]
MSARLLVAGIAGLATACAFPKPGIAGLGWVGPGLMLVSAVGLRGREVFGLGYAAGLVQWLVALGWLLYIPFPSGAMAGWLSLSAYLALYPAFWVWGCWKVAESFGHGKSILDPHPNPAAMGAYRPGESTGESELLEEFCRTGDPTHSYRLHEMVQRGFTRLNLLRAMAACHADTSWLYRMTWPVACAALWVAGEMVMARLWTGFPWNFLGVSQYQVLPVIQISSITGVYGVSFLMVWFAVAGMGAALSLLHHPAQPRMAMTETFLPLFAVASVMVFGLTRLRASEAAEAPVKMALVQPSIPQTLIWDPQEDTRRFEKVLELSKLALRTRPDLLVWPEAAIPKMLRYDDVMLQAVTNLARDHKTWMVVGADDAEPSRKPGKEGETDFFNASFLIDPEGRLAARYCKRRLVVFGEYVPLQPWFFFLRWFTPIRDGFTPGHGPFPFDLEPPKIRISVLICFEDTFPHLVRVSADETTDLLLNLTNNGWFGESSAQWQHAANAVFRAIENGLPLVRCANNGLTCWVDPQGRLRGVNADDPADVYGPGFKIFDVPLRRDRPGHPTVYQRYGDWFGWGCAGISALLVARCLGFRRFRFFSGNTDADQTPG